jgi:hypothetical protein
MIMLYFNEPDSSGHAYGPDSAAVSIQTMDLNSEMNTSSFSLALCNHALCHLHDQTGLIKEYYKIPYIS